MRTSHETNHDPASYAEFWLRSGALAVDIDITAMIMVIILIPISLVFNRFE